MDSCSKSHRYHHRDFGWKVEFSLRAGLSTAFAMTLLFIGSSRSAIQLNDTITNGAAFAGFMTVLICDVTFGRSIMNAWGCILVGFPTSIVCSLILLAGEGYSAAVALPSLAVLTFVVSMLNVPVLGKKLALSLIALNLITASANWKAPMVLFLDSLFGMGLGILGNVLPYPRLAIWEFDTKTRNVALGLGRLLDHLFSELSVLNHDDLSSVERRNEVLGILRSDLSLCRSRLEESRWGPKRWEAVLRDQSLLEMLDQLSLSCVNLCELFPKLKRNVAMEKILALVKVELKGVNVCICKSLQHIEERGEGSDAALLLENLDSAKRTFEDAYFKARQRVYYANEEEQEKLDPHTILYFNALLFEVDLVFSTLAKFLKNETSFATAKKLALCFDKNLFKDLFPSQSHLLKLNGQILIRALKLSLSMTLAGIYGYYAFNEQAPEALPAFTIAYIATDINQGSVVWITILRLVGTVLGAVWAILVAYPQFQYKQGQYAFVGTAAVIFVIGTTFLRCNPSISYLGTVAGFTSTLLLVDIPEDNVGETSETRIVDTFVGCFILLIVELSIVPMRSQTLLLEKISGMLRGAIGDVSKFAENVHKLEDVERSQTMYADLRKRGAAIDQHRQLLVATAQEPTLWHIPVKRNHLYQLIHEESKIIYAGIQLLLITNQMAGISLGTNLLVEQLKHQIVQVRNELPAMMSQILAGIQALENGIFPDEADNDKKSSVAASSTFNVLDKGRPVIFGWDNKDDHIDVFAAKLERELMTCFEKAVEALQQGEQPEEEERKDEDEESVITISVISSNEEIKFVSAMMYPIVELLRSIQQLARIIYRAQSARYLSTADNLVFHHRKSK